MGFSLFRSPQNPITTDVHSHFLPGVDDGAKSIEESQKMILKMASLGYRKLITTPHIYRDYYPNEEEDLLLKFEAWKGDLEESDLDISLSAEYYADEHLIEKLKSKRPLLTFGEKCLLFETSFHVKPTILDELIFEMRSSGYTPVMAHPERYDFANESFLSSMLERGVKMQVSIPTVVGAYGSRAKNVAKWLAKNNSIHLIGSDLHNHRQVEVIQKAVKTRLYQRITRNLLINNEL